MSEPTLIQSNFLGTCAICHRVYIKGERVWWDKEKSKGKRVVHERCWIPPMPFEVFTA